MTAADFGESFAWGVASSPYQTEGLYEGDGKGLSIWDVFTSLSGEIKNKSTGTEACDFYNRYMQDLILLQYLNIKNFRLSISWPRILPDGTGRKNEKGLDYYDRLIDFCLEMGIDPWITLYHWDLPQLLQEKGGWTNRDIISWFTEYVITCAWRYRDRVKHWMVLNEPLVFTGAGYFLGQHAPGKKGLKNFLPAAHHAVLCQSIGAHILKSIDPALHVGTTFSFSHIDPASELKSDIKAAQRADAIVNRMFLEPLLGLGYPIADLPVLNRMDKYIYPGDERLMTYPVDFIGIQNYTREVVRYNPLVPYIHAKNIKAIKRDVPVSTAGQEIFPESIYHILKKVSAYKSVKKIIITENGIALNDIVQEGKIHDRERIHFLNACLQQVLRAKEEGIPVEGYFARNFMDNFEQEGCTQRLGLVHVDFKTQKRTIKDSGRWFRQLLSTTDNNCLEKQFDQRKKSVLSNIIR